MSFLRNSSGSTLENGPAMATTSQETTLGNHRPTVIWQLRRGKDETASAVVFPLRNDATVFLWINQEVEDARYFTTVSRAVEEADHMRTALTELGWVPKRSRSARQLAV